MRKNQGVELSLKPVNMKGGGYLNFLDYVKSDAKNNCLAKFIVVDADKARDDPGERKNLKAVNRLLQSSEQERYNSPFPDP